MPVLMPNSTTFRNYLNKEITKRLDSPLIFTVDSEKYWGLDPSRNMHRALGDLPLGVDVLEAYYELDENIGMADEYDLYSDDIKLVELDGYGFGKFNTVVFARAINWTWGEINKYKTASDLGLLIQSLNPVEAKLERLGKYFNKREHYTVLYGYPKRKIYGLFSQKGVSFQDALFRPYAKTGDTYTLPVRDLVANLKTIAYAAMDRFKLSSPSSLFMGVTGALYNRLTDPYIDANLNERGTGLQYLKSTDNGLGMQIEVFNELKGTNLTQFVPNEAESGMYDPAFDRMLLRPVNYKPERHYYARKTFPPFQKSTMRSEQIGLTQTSGLILRDYNNWWYYDYSNATA